MKKSDRDKIAKNQWSMIGLMQVSLLSYAILDFAIQLIFQMPMVLPEHLNTLRHFGFRKIWHFTNDVHLGDLTYKDWINCDPWDGQVRNQNCPHFYMESKAFYFEVMICLIAAIIIL